MTRLPADIEALLNGSGLPWRVVMGSRHRKVFVGNRLCAIIPTGGSTRLLSMPGRAQRNTISQIRRAIREQAK
jgi:hypothetical protein